MSSSDESDHECTTTTKIVHVHAKKIVAKKVGQQVKIDTTCKKEIPTCKKEIPTCKKQISGTYLKADTWYRITLQAGGLFTWMYSKVGDFNHTMIVYKSPAKEYIIGERYYHDAHWKVVESEEPGYVTFVNRNQPNAVLTWAGKASTGKYVVLYLDNAKNPDYLPGGKYRDDCLWKIVPEKGVIGTYSILNKRLGGNVNYSYSNVADGKKHVIVYESTSPEYAHDPEYLWNFHEIIN